MILQGGVINNLTTDLTKVVVKRLKRRLNSKINNMRIYLIIFLSLLFISTASVKAQEAISEEIMANMTELLDLSDKQQAEVSALLAKYRSNIDWIVLKYEGEEEPDVGKMIGEIRDERDSYRRELQTVLSANQMKTYETKVDQVLTDMFNDLAEIRLIEIQDQVNLTDGQIASLTPILGKSIKSTLQLLIQNAGTKLTLPKKIGIKNSLKKIEKEKRDGMKNILTPDQLAIYDKYKEDQKAARKANK